jgi:choline/glycine/proline betaine transport protein
MKKYFDVYPRVFYPSLIFILGFVFLSILGGEPVRAFFDKTAYLVTESTGWLFILGVNLFVVICLYIAFSKYGKHRLGGKHAKPEFTVFSWFAMLFSAGMGIGLLYFSVSEPITHFANPPIPVDSVKDRAIQALDFTFLHYGLHAWAIYCIVGLSLAYYGFSKKLPFSLRSIFFPVLGRKIFGKTGDIIDVIAVVATLFGLATSLGFGARQIATGLNYLFGVDPGQGTQISIIVVITLIATISVVTGLKKGVKFLSRLNLFIALIFLVSMLFLSDALSIIRIFVESTGQYFDRFIELGTVLLCLCRFLHCRMIGPYSIGLGGSLGHRLSGCSLRGYPKGRTVREFVLGVLLVPTLMTFFWISVFGGSALSLEIENPGVLSEIILNDSSTSLFVFLQEFPLPALTSFLGIFMVAVFFVTSSDSGSLVIDSITAGGKLDAPVGQRILWALTEGAVAIALLLGGGLKAMQTASVSTGILFLFVIFVMVYSLLKSFKRLKHFKRKEDRLEKKNRKISL